MRSSVERKCALLVYLLWGSLAACSRPYVDVREASKQSPAKAVSGHADVHPAATWNKKAAATYLDQRETWWMQWEATKRDHDTFCVSCHTTLPFIFAQPALRDVSSETNSLDNDSRIIEDVKKRVRLWNSVTSYYGDKDDGAGNGAGSRATEAVLNAVILACHDSQTGQLSDEALMAFRNMWALQLSSGREKGAWLWQKFGLSPWESNDSPYFGATLAALAVGMAPASYRSNPDIQNNLAFLRGYLDREYSQQSLFNRIGLLWAATKWPGLLTAEQQNSIIDEIYGKQHADGGWSLASLMWSPRYFGIPSLLAMGRRNDGTPQEAKSDGLATGYVAFVLQQTGVPHVDLRLKNALVWLTRNQNATEGYWTAFSLNRRRDASSNVGRFMTDAATAFAVLALSEKGS
jgi:squalene-hopene/tetraprenyl-beta-curcumene cyclase